MELADTHRKGLNARIENLEQFILSGPSSDINSDEVAMEYMRNIGKLESLKEARELFEHNVRAYLG